MSQDSTAEAYSGLPEYWGRLPRIIDPDLDRSSSILTQLARSCLFRLFSVFQHDFLQGPKRIVTLVS